MLPWIIFSAAIIFLLVMDLGVFNRKDHVMSFKESLFLSLFYITIACFFGVYVYYSRGPDSASEYFTGFLLEKAMAIDNIFVISIIFKFFGIPLIYQHRVLFWGILGVIVLRGIMILLGSIILAKFSWVLFIFAAILIWTGIKTWMLVDNHQMNVQDMWIYSFLRSRFRIYPKIESNKFFVRTKLGIAATPLFMALVTVEFMDVIFAIDSIPAIFAITQDIFIVYTSNIFAILGLRAMFFLLADLTERFKMLKYSLAIILILIGIKIFVAHFIDIPKLIPLIITIGILTGGILYSIYLDRNKSQAR